VPKAWHTSVVPTALVHLWCSIAPRLKTGGYRNVAAARLGRITWTGFKAPSTELPHQNLYLTLNCEIRGEMTAVGLYSEPSLARNVEEPIVTP